MGLEELKGEIIESASKRSSEILEQGKKEADSIIAKAKEQVKAYKAKLKEDEKNLILSLEKMKIAQTKSEVKKQLLDKKKTIIDSVFDKVKQKLETLPENKRKSYIEALLKKASEEIELAKVYCNKKDSNLFNDIETASADMTGGLIAENKEATMRVDYSFDTIIEGIKENSLQEIAGILFEN